VRKLSTIVFMFAVLLVVAAACGGGGGPQPGPITPPPTPPPATNEVSGVLTDSYGNPVTDASLLLNGVDIGVETDSTGRFTIPDGLVRANERFRLGVRNRGVLMGEREFQVGDSWEVEWQLGQSDPEGGTVNGLVVDAETESPVTEALIVLFADDGWVAVGLTGDDGTYEFAGVPGLRRTATWYQAASWTPRRARALPAPMSRATPTPGGIPSCWITATMKPAEASGHRSL